MLIFGRLYCCSRLQLNCSDTCQIGMWFKWSMPYFCVSKMSLMEESIHWSRVTHICVSRLTITGSDNGLSPGRRQAIIWTNAGILLIGPLGTNFSENLIAILTFSFTKMRLKVSSAKWRPFCLGLNVLTFTGRFGTPTLRILGAWKCTMVIW